MIRAMQYQLEPSVGQRDPTAHRLEQKHGQLVKALERTLCEVKEASAPVTGISFSFRDEHLGGWDIHWPGSWIAEVDFDPHGPKNPYLRHLIAQAVREAEADGAQAVYLSGGIDSSTIASHAKHLPAFTGWYMGEPYDERKYAKLVGMDRHTTIQIKPEDFIECFDAMLAAVEPPYTGPGMVGQYVVAREVAKHGVSCVMSGEGGDELFGGYARLLIVAGKERPVGYEDYRVPDDYPDNIEAALAYDFAALDNLIRVDDQIAAAHGITVKTPLLHPDIVEHVLSLSPHERVGKKLLREAMRGIVPDEILDRTDKRGFPVPFVHWAQEEPLKSFLRGRIGYVPDPARPWSREWWNDLLAASQ